jgi:hypothetical protein
VTEDFRLHSLSAARVKRAAARRAHPCQVVVVRASVLKEALRLAGGDASRLRIKSSVTVEVWPPKP